MNPAAYKSPAPVESIHLAGVALTLKISFPFCIIEPCEPHFTIAISQSLANMLTAFCGSSPVYASASSSLAKAIFLY